MFMGFLGGVSATSVVASVTAALFQMRGEREARAHALAAAAAEKIVHRVPVPATPKDAFQKRQPG